MASIKIDDITREGSGVRVDWSAILDDVAYDQAQQALAQARQALDADPTNADKQKSYAVANAAAEPDGGRHVEIISLELLQALIANPMITMEQANQAIEALIMPKFQARVKELQGLRAAYEIIGKPRIGQRITVT